MSPDAGSILQPWHIWLIVAVICVIGEMLTTGFVLLCFAVGAVITAIPAFMQVELKYQLMVFAVATVVVLATFRRLYLNWLTKGQGAPTNVEALCGRDGIVLADIENTRGTGRVKVGGEDWSARSESGDPIAADSVVTVKKIDGNKVIVVPKTEKPAEKADEKSTNKG